MDELREEADNKRVYVIQIDDSQCGFFAIYRYILEYIYFADKLNMIPVIDIKNCLYKEKATIFGTDNPYEYYFKQPLNKRIEEISDLDHKCYSKVRDREIVSISFVGESATYNITEDYMDEMALVIKRYVKLNQKTQEYIEKSIQEIIGSKKVLGVHIRGTDFEVEYTNHPKFVALEDYFSVIDEQLQRNDWDGIFLATDDNRILKKMKERYGQKLLTYTNYRGDHKESIAFSDDARDKHKYTLGLEVLRDAYTLAACLGMVCGVSQVAICARMIKISQGQRYGFLKVLEKGISKDGLAFVGNVMQCKEESIETSQEYVQKLREFYSVMNQWLYIHHSKRSLVDYFEKYQYKNIAIYGMRELGRNLCDELQYSNVSVDYFIDMSKGVTYKSLKRYSPNDDLPPVDVIIVTAIHYYDDIRNKLSDRVQCPIISLDKVIRELV